MIQMNFDPNLCGPYITISENNKRLTRIYISGYCDVYRKKIILSLF